MQLIDVYLRQRDTNTKTCMSRKHELELTRPEANYSNMCAR